MLTQMHVQTSDFSSSDKLKERTIAGLFFWQVAQRSVIGLHTTMLARKFLHTLQNVVYAMDHSERECALS